MVDGGFVQVRMANTRRVYRFEDITHFGGYAESWLSYRDACEFVDRVWHEESVPLLNPVIIPYSKWHRSIAAALYYPYGHQIAIDSCYRSRAVILHELTHAMGYGDHNNGFAGQLMALLERYARVPMGVMAIGAAWVGMNVMWAD